MPVGTIKKPKNAMKLDEIRQLMSSGNMYNDLEPELVLARERAVLLTSEYNGSYGKPPEQRLAILRRLFQKVGEGAYFEPSLRCEFGFNISIGQRFYANFDCVILDGASVQIGDNVLFGPRVGIYTANHALDPSERAAGGCRALPVCIGHRVWIGAGVHINPGVTIGDDTIVGAGSVVTKRLPSGVLAAGVPCRVIREITDQDKTGYAGQLP